MGRGGGVDLVVCDLGEMGWDGMERGGNEVSELN